ncbi:hypothetical protein [Methanohalophilus profundi]|uniref:hypothetical protein n=1 Tax=Methanohalophilus profundi TaxID=2138083 RepID=UPI00101B9E9A|nr:hypothetical protein [Methanohalophilus profundi]
MNWKKIIVSAFAGGLILTVAGFVFQILVNAIAPFNMLEVGGMRPADDPLMMLFFAYPFVFTFAAAILFDIINPVLEEPTTKRGITFGLMVVLIYTIPGLFVIYISMLYPAGFYISNVLTGLISYPVFGVVMATVWETMG